MATTALAGEQAAVKVVVFFRAVNLGQKNCPSRAQFEATFREAGGEAPRSFLTNGTLVFNARHETAARRIVRAARKRLAETCGLTEPAFLRRLDDMARLVESDPFAGISRRAVYRFCVSFFDGKPAGVRVPRRSSRGDVEVVRLTRGEMLSIVRKLGSGPGSPTLLLENALGRPATTRVWNTLVRLVARFHND